MAASTVARLSIQKCILSICGELSKFLSEEIDKEKRCWVRQWISRREAHGASSTLLAELTKEDPEEYRNCMRMTKVQFSKLLSKIKPLISKEDTIMRSAISAKIKLETTLSYLATGNSYRSLQRLFRLSRPAISKFVPEVCEAIYRVLEEYIKVPTSEMEWRVIEEGFRHRWNFPSCYGAIDGKHVVIRAPSQCRSKFFNYKDTNSIILLTVVDHNYCFQYINVGCTGRHSDGGVFQQSSMLEAIEHGLLPDNGCLVGDDAFPLKTYLLKPYKGTLTKEQEIFNYRLSRARRMVENAFGIMVSRFRIFEKAIACSPETVNKIIKVCCALHNWLRTSSSTYYTPKGSFDEEDLDSGKIIPGAWRQDINKNLASTSFTGSNHSSRMAREKRDRYCQYFMKQGAVPWQDRMIF